MHTILYTSIYDFIHTIKYYSYKNIRYSIQNILLKLNITTDKNNTIKNFSFNFFISIKLVNLYIMVTFCMDSNYFSKHQQLL